MKSLNVNAMKLPSTHKIKQEWSTILNKNNGKPSAADHVYYILLRAVIAKYPDTPAVIAQRLKDAFPPVTNTKKLYSGRRAYDTVLKILSQYNYIYSIVVKPRFGVDAFTHLQVLNLAREVYNVVK